MRTLLAALCLALAPVAALAAPCASSVAELRALFEDPAFPLSWEETSMRDGRPLLVTLDERQGGLFISFVKSGEGLWAEGVAVLCRAGDRMEARFSQDTLRVGPAAHWVLRRALEAGAAIRLRRVNAQELRIGTLGWTGSFAPGPTRIGLKASW
jgi:hypothetical protein